jgi:hypothetical protein
MSLFSLSKYIFLSVCTDWFDMKDLCRLDTATVNKNRFFFLEIIGSYHAIFFGLQDCVVGDNYLNWLKLRSVSVSHIKFNGNKLFNTHYLAELDNPDAINKMLHALKSIRMELFDENILNKSFFLHLIRNTPSIEELYLASCEFLDEDIMVDISKCCPRLKKIDLKGCDMLTLDAIHMLCNSTDNGSDNTHSQLVDINLQVEFLPKEALTTISASCPRLMALSIANCHQYGDEEVQVLTERCPLLRELDLNGCSGLTNKSILAVAKHCTGLEQLHISNSQRITDEALKALGRSCPRLTVLNTSRCEYVTSVGIAHIAGGCPMLRTLRISGKQMDDPALSALSTHCPLLEELNLGMTYGSDPSEDLLVALVTTCTRLRLLSFGMGYRQLDAVFRKRLLAAHSGLVVLGGDSEAQRYFD